ncbi:MAG: C-GCAxxG-C-C family protein [Chloroflexi bacterium]|nr:C-GCAxxG-C-C family protein [Chloroflexota bacterium]
MTSVDNPDVHPIMANGVLSPEEFQALPPMVPPDLSQVTLDELASWAGERANRFRLEGFHCSESVLRATALAIGVELPEAVLRVSTGFRGGGGGYGDRCGALNSGGMLVSYLYGRLTAAEDNTCASELTRILHQRWDDELGSTHCSVLNRFYSKQVPDASCSIVYDAGSKIIVKVLGEAALLCPACTPLPQLARLKKS